MAFLDNSGDILLDAVLTDAGRKRMAEGNFKITKFALADDEIDYSLYNSNDSRGSAYYDLDILSTPILEAFTDNMSGLKSKLISIPQTDLLFLPVIKLYTGATSSKTTASGSFFVLVNDGTGNSNTATTFANSPASSDGVLGENTSYNNQIILDQGIDSEEVDFTSPLDQPLVESQYIVEMDDRLLKLVDAGNIPGAYAYLDDDNKASYYITNDSGTSANNDYIEAVPNENKADSSIRGQRGTRLTFKLWSSRDANVGNNLFLKLGAVVNYNAVNYYYIDTIVRVMGATTGYSVDIPVRLLRKQ